MNIAGIIHESLNDGIGIRTVIFISGCKHNCEGCQNTELFNFNYGKKFDDKMQKYIINYIKTDPLIDGITISGGDPMYSSTEITEFLKKLKMEIPQKTVWLYTGFLWEEISDNEILEYVDVVVDGKFIESQKDRTLKFKGSKNQRIIDVKKTLKFNKIILWEE